MGILRHDDWYTIETDLDPIEDILNFIITLKSLGFTADLLRETHGFTNTAEIKKTAKLISLHVDSAVGLAQQGLGGPPETSFLPLYYSTLNLSKVYLLMLGKRKELERNRWHGAKYKENEMNRLFLNERIYIIHKGTIPLLYHAVTGKSISRSGLSVALNELYKSISSIEAEFNTITRQNSGFLAHTSEIIQDDANGHYMKVEIFDSRYLYDPPLPRTLKAYPGLKIVRTSSGIAHYETRKYRGQFETVKRDLINKIKRYLISGKVKNFRGRGPEWICFTPINGRFHVFSEELCIMLAYFHLSNVVRYNPEHLRKLMNSKYWSIMLGLRKHGYLRFEKLMWGNFIRKSFDIE